MPPHPTLFVRRRVYENAGFFDTRFRIAADYEFMLRPFEGSHVSSCYIPRVLVRMRTGGISNRSLWNLWSNLFEDYRAWQVIVNGRDPRRSTPGSGGLVGCVNVNA